MAMKNKEPGFVAELKRHMGVLVEGLRLEIRIVAEQYGGLVSRMDRVEVKLEEHDSRFDSIDRRLNVIEIDLKGVKAAMFDVSHRLDNHEVRICRLQDSK